MSARTLEHCPTCTCRPMSSPPAHMAGNITRCGCGVCNHWPKTKRECKKRNCGCCGRRDSDHEEPAEEPFDYGDPS